MDSKPPSSSCAAVPFNSMTSVIFPALSAGLSFDSNQRDNQ
ncbi:hypothetical protein [Mucilaginibacter jinjuensis]|uniref:Uncharacterized protein n=1 Tax=Mucilaginibacter jinjuensis TaxID=1176721 RepID=A0ABY7TBG1_9SPHI|nr:hypothetical protein [Mucilaginibacter jinjuensis]WCT13786.1 hypothetical protein PQO05_07540 [Mucilaginibacter jinjuensis]